jgi:hypothetical protein
MSVWETLIGIAAKALKDKPRRDVLSALVALRSSMITCQRTYDDYQELLKQGNYDELMQERCKTPNANGEYMFIYNPKNCWEMSVCRLADDLIEVDYLLQILSPEAANALTFYARTEAEVGQRDLPRKPIDPAEVLERETGINLEAESLSKQFRGALAQLDTFIRNNFKPEEVFVAQKGVRLSFEVDLSGNWVRIH